MKSIALVIDGSENDPVSLRTAVAFARNCGAILTVYHNRVPPTATIAAFDMAIAAVDVMPDSDEALKRARAAYDSEAGGYEGARFIVVEGILSDVLEQAAPYCDLLLLERLSSSEGPDAIALNDALWEVRSPVLVVPQEPATGPLDKIVLSWNATPQAGRALRAAMPLVERAGSLTILSRAGGEKDAELEKYLGAHKIAVSQWKIYGDENLSARGWARSLLAEVAKLDASLLVMGAFGGAVTSLLGFGRATEKIATSTKIPVLFSA
jgi:nucleotide-binding universal stress UspA family protein